MKVFLILLFVIVLSTQACRHSPCPCFSKFRCHGKNQVCIDGYCTSSKALPNGSFARENDQASESKKDIEKKHCIINLECPPDNLCINGECVPLSSIPCQATATTPYPGFCTKDSDCRPLETCNNGKCGLVFPSNN
uniref:CC domain-containing protein n=1 Tax=Caenorhabditis tropicalis TaxID=1561998 RepID=A0A1I7UFJ5_9PELO